MSDQKGQPDMADLASDLPAATAALSAEDREDLLNAIKNKLQDLAGEHHDFLETLSPNVRKRVDALKGIQTQYDELEAKYFQERAALEAKYQKLYEPVYAKRYEIVNGIVEVEGVASGSEAKQEIDQSTEEKGVPRFWLTAMKNNEVLSEEITKRDEEALKYLKDIKWSKLDGSKGFKLDFFFDPNPYFKNSVLTKTYFMISEDEHILENATGTEIEWFSGKNLTQKILKKIRKKGSEDTKPITRTEDCISFFNFFKPPQVPEDEDEIDEETAELLQSQMEQDYSIGSTIREKIIPHAVSWYTGEAAKVDDEETEDDTDDVEEEDGEDESEDEDADKEEDEKITKKGDESTDTTGTVAR